MSAIPHHTSDPVCLLCEQKLGTAHQRLQDWFRQVVKPKHPDAHVSWAYRGKEDQEAAVRRGASKLHFPNSKHNKTPAEALDLFRINDQGKAVWDLLFFEAVNRETIAAGINLLWGAKFVIFSDFRDLDHFQIPTLQNS